MCVDTVRRGGGVCGKQAQRGMCVGTVHEGDNEDDDDVNNNNNNNVPLTTSPLSVSSFLCPAFSFSLQFF